MTRLLVAWLAMSTVFVGVAAALPTVKVRSWGAAFAAAAVFGLLNLLLGWLLSFLLKVFLVVPALLTLGLVWLLVPILVNMVILRFTDGVMGDKLQIRGLGPLFLFALAVSLTNAVVWRLF